MDWELDYKESWALKNWCFWTVVMEKTLESPLDFKEIQPVHPKGNQSWMFFGRSEDEAETPILWPPDMKNWLIGKDPDAGKDRRLEVKGTQRMSLLDGITYSMDMSLNKLLVMNREAWCAPVHGLQSRTRLSDWTELNWTEDFRIVMLQRLLRVSWAARDQTSWSWRKSPLNIHLKAWCWSWNSNTLATWCKEPAHWKRPWYQEILKAKKRVAEDEMIILHHQLNVHELE